MPKDLWKLVLKGAVGFLIGLAVWSGLSQPYARVLASLSETVIRLAERPAVTSITAEGTLMMVARSDFPQPASSGSFAVESTDITFNIILLVTLFAASRRALSDRNMFGFAAAAVALVFVHVAASVSFVEAWYVGSFGKTTAAHYGIIARRFWEAAPYFYSLVGTYGSAIALWWLLRPLSESAPKRPLQRRKTTKIGT